MLVSGGMVIGEFAKPTIALVDKVTGSFDEWSRGRQYLNFREERTDPGAAYDAATLERLRAVRHAVDPGGLFQANHEL